MKDEISAQENEWNVECNDLSKRLKIIEHRDEMRLRHDKKNNIIIRGLSFTTENYRQEVTDMLKEKLQLEVNVVDASLIKTAKGPHLLWAKVGDYENKRSIMMNKRKLQATDIFISNDRTLKERAIQIELQKIADVERKQGKEVKLGYQKITIDGAVRVWQNGFGLTTPKKILYWSANT